MLSFEIVHHRKRQQTTKRKQARIMGDYYGHGGGGAAQTTATTPRSTTMGGTSMPGSSLAHSDSCKIFVGGLSWQTTEESLRWSFEQYGQVVSVEVMRDRNTGEPRGFAFVVFADASTVDLVIADKGKISVNHKLVDVKRAMARGQAPPSIHVKHNNDSAGGASGARSGTYGPADNAGTEGRQHQHQTPEQMHTKVFVGGLPPAVDRDELKQIFQQFGTVVDAIVMLDQVTQRSRCFGFVTFGGDDGTAAAQRSIQAQPVPVHGRQVEVKLATPRSEQIGGAGGGAGRRAPPPGPKHVGLRAGQMSVTAGSGEFAGLAVAYGRNGWKAGFGTKAFGKAGWAVEGWEDTGGPVPEQSGFSFKMLEKANAAERPSKRPRH